MKMENTPQTRKYLKKMWRLYESNKLSEQETMQFLQDSVDSGFGWELGPEFSRQLKFWILIKVLNPPPSGFVPQIPKYELLIKKKLVRH